MAHALLASTTAGNTSVTSQAVTRPGGVVDGAHMVLVVYVETASTLSVTGTWTLVHQTPQPSGSTFQQATYVRIASSEPASWTISWSPGGAAWCTAGFMAFSGGDAVTIQDAAGTENSGSGTTATGLGLTTNTGNALLLLSEVDFNGASASRSGYTSPITITNEIDFANVAMAYGIQASAGASGDKTATLSISTAWTAHLLALRAVPDAPAGIAPGTPTWGFPHPPMRIA